MIKVILSWLIRILIAALFLVSAYAKIYPEPSAYFSITTFEAKQLVPLGFDPLIAALFSRFLIALEFTMGILILFPFQLKRVIVPSTIGILAFFSIHLAIQIMLTGNAGNCGCFGALLEMTPLEAIVKNAIAILFLVLLFFLLEKEKFQLGNFLYYFPVFFFFIAVLFVFIPIKKAPKQSMSEFSETLPFADDGKVLLCFFAPGCDHCRAAIRSLDSLNNIMQDNFPSIEVVFMEEEIEKIPDFFEYAGNEYNYRILDIPSFYNVLTWERNTPAVFYMWNGNVITEFNGIEKEAFDPSKLVDAINSN